MPTGSWRRIIFLEGHPNLQYAGAAAHRAECEGSA